MREKERPVTLRVTPETRDEVLAQRKKDSSKRGGIESADDVLKRHLKRTYVEYDLSSVRQELAGKMIKEVVTQGPDPYTMTVISDDGTQVKIIGDPTEEG